MENAGDKNDLQQENVIKSINMWQRIRFLSKIQVKQLTNPCHDPRFMISWISNQDIIDMRFELTEKFDHWIVLIIAMFS